MSTVESPALGELTTDPDALPSLPGVAMEVLRLIEAEDCDLSKLCEADVRATAEMLRIELAPAAGGCPSSA